MEREQGKIFLSLMDQAGMIESGKPKTVSIERKRAYWRLLKDYPIEELAKAFDAHAKNPEWGAFFPKPADLIREIHAKRGDLRTKRKTGINRIPGAIRLSLLEKASEGEDITGDYARLESQYAND